MEALQKELTKYFRERIDAAMKEEIANRATTEHKFHEVYACYLPMMIFIREKTHYSVQL